MAATPLQKFSRHVPARVGGVESTKKRPFIKTQKKDKLGLIKENYIDRFAQFDGSKVRAHQCDQIWQNFTT